MISSLSPHRETSQVGPTKKTHCHHQVSCGATASQSRNIMKTIQFSCNNAELGLVNQLTLLGKSPCSSSGAHYNDAITTNNDSRRNEMRKKPQEQSATATATATGLTRTRTVQSFCASSNSTVSSSHGSSLGLLNNKDDSQAFSTDTFSSSSSDVATAALPIPSPDFTTFGMDLRRYTCESPDVPVFDSGMRQVLEPHMRKARLAREKARRRRRTFLNVHDSIASSVDVPYVRLRSERPFLYDTYTHPMHQVLAETLGVDDLSQLHQAQLRQPSAEQPSPSGESPNADGLERLMAPLKCRDSRRQFQESYDNFVTSFCIPLLHSMAMSQNLFHGVHSGSKNTRISYRYQAFPNISVSRPGDASQGPQCDTSKGHNVGFLHFHIPLTPSYGSNALYTESHPGKEDWHPLQTKSTGMGFLFDGGRCIHFNMENTTESTLVALDFVVAIYHSDLLRHEQERHGEHPMVDPHGLCNQIALEDPFSLSGPGFYDEAVIDIRPGSRMWQCVAKKKRDRKHKLLDPGVRNGFPFA